MIRHIVMWKLKPEPGARERVKELLETCAFATPGMLKYEVGFDLGVDGAPWDVVLYSEFADRAALEAYQRHPAHLAIKPEIGKVRDSRAAVDYETHAPA